MKLVSIPFSHYCEKARWSLQHAGLAFVEDGHLPLLHWRASFAAGGGRTVPVLVTDDAGVLADSTDILRYADARAADERKLGADDVDVMTLEERFDVDLGPHARRLGYFHLFPNRALLLKLATRGVPAWEAKAITAGFPLARGLMKRGMRIDDEGARRSLAKVDAVFHDVGALLADGRRFLTGDRFTAADLTFAALASPILQPEELVHGIPLDVMPPPMRELRDRLVATAAGQHALRMYREHRGI